jgi:hypothetical protein
MADISNVDTATIKELYTSLESLPCKITSFSLSHELGANTAPARIMTRVLY